jgi:hypothetical protein
MAAQTAPTESVAAEPAPSTSRGLADFSATLARSETQLYQRFQHLLRSARIPSERSASLCEGVSTPVHAASLVRAVEQVLESVTELRLSRLLGDVVAMNGEVDARCARAQRSSALGAQKLARLHEDSSVLLEELEDHLAASQASARRWRPLDGPPRE